MVSQMKESPAEPGLLFCSPFPSFLRAAYCLLRKTEKKLQKQIFY